MSVDMLISLEKLPFLVFDKMDSFEMVRLLFESSNSRARAKEFSKELGGRTLNGSAVDEEEEEL